MRAYTENVQNNAETQQPTHQLSIRWCKWSQWNHWIRL